MSNTPAQPTQPFCQCYDPDCPHNGPLPCPNEAEVDLYRVDQHDPTGTSFCAVCCLDAMSTGMFADKAVS